MTHPLPRTITALLAAILTFLPLVGSAAGDAAEAWWDKAWTGRKSLDVKPSAAGRPTGAVPVLVRLHEGNFPFAALKEDGSDLRVLATITRPSAFPPRALRLAHERGLPLAAAPGNQGGRGSDQGLALFWQRRRRKRGRPEGDLPGSRRARLPLRGARGPAARLLLEGKQRHRRPDPDRRRAHRRGHHPLRDERNGNPRGRLAEVGGRRAGQPDDLGETLRPLQRCGGLPPRRRRLLFRARSR